MECTVNAGTEPKKKSKKKKVLWNFTTKFVKIWPKKKKRIDSRDAGNPECGNRFQMFLSLVFLRAAYDEGGETWRCNGGDIVDKAGATLGLCNASCSSWRTK